MDEDWTGSPGSGRKRTFDTILETPCASDTFDENEDMERHQPSRNERISDDESLDNGISSVGPSKFRYKRARKSEEPKLEPTPETSDAEMEDSLERNGGPSQALRAGSGRRKPKGTPLKTPLDPNGEGGTIARLVISGVLNHGADAPLSVDFSGNKVNFITGQNGSGKSAILTALMIVLGGTAKSTSRAPNVAGLINDETRSAEITAYLRNTGDEAYRPETFGDHIRIVRRLARNGTGSYKVQDSSGVTVSSTFSALQEILDHFSIDVTNPVCILTQETAKTFFGTFKEENYYRFFLEGTGLQQLKDELLEIKERAARVGHSLPDIKEARDQTRREKDRLQERYDRIEASSNLEESIGRLKEQLAWSFVEEAEKAVADKAAEEKRLVDKVDKVAERFEQFNEAGTQWREAIANQAQQVDAKEEEKRTAENNLKTAKLQLDIASKKVDAVQSEINHIKQTITENEASIAGIEQTLQDETERAEGRNRDQLARLQRQRRDDEAELAATTAELEKLVEETIPGLDRQLADFSRKIREAEDKEERLLRRAQSTEERIRDIRESRQDNYRPFGKNVALVVKDIEAAARSNRWRGQTPIGPLGKFVKLKDLKWGDLAEATLGSILNAFAVENRDDEELLRQILNRHACKSEIVRGNWEPMSLHGKEPDPRYTTMMRVLEFEHEVVKKFLIITNRIESLVLAETRADGQKLYEEWGEKYAHHVVSLMCFKPHIMTIGSRNGGNQVISDDRDLRGLKRLTKATSEDVAALEDTLRVARAELEATRRLLHEEQRNHGMEGIRQQKATCLARKRDLESKERRIRQSLEHLTEQIQENSQTVDVSSLLREKKRIQDELDMNRMQCLGAEDRKPDLEAESDRCSQIVRQSKRKLDKVADELNTLISEKDDLQQKLADHEKARNPLRQKKQAWEQELAQVRTELAELRDKLEEDEAEAREYCDKVPVTKSRETIERELRNKQIQLEEQEARLGNAADVRRDLEIAKQKFARSNAEFKDLLKLESSLTDAIGKRWAQWPKFLSFHASCTKQCFSVFLQGRRFIGKIKFHHPARVDNTGHAPPGRLEFDVKPPHSDQASSAGGIHTLSGGEKSFSQIGFLVSLAESMSMPIRCLDEFDIYMDAETRTTALKELLKTALASRNHQHILITPQTIGSLHNLELDEGVNLQPEDYKIVALPNPGRSQGSLGQTPLDYSGN